MISDGPCETTYFAGSYIDSQSVMLEPSSANSTIESFVPSNLFSATGRIDIFQILVPLSENKGGEGFPKPKQFPS